ncbi:MAG: hypothetical protein CFE38_05125 [Comamonadaceae bacterium PBBC1]|nr:MAG: hypothetical protein CFE38_05125 [Comamonadaceae bacterium PBBC1]
MNTTTAKSVLGQLPPVRLAQAASSTTAMTLSTWVLTAGVAALVVLADHLLDNWAETHLVAAWLALWAVAVFGIVTLRGVSRWFAQFLMKGLNNWSAHVARRRADERLWAMAQTDSRLMQDLQTAMDRADTAESTPMDLTTYMTRRAARLVNNRLYYL